MLTDREILDAIPTNQFDEQTKMLWFGRFIERMVLDKLSKQQAIDLNTNDLGEPDAIYLQLHDPDDVDVTQKADFTGDGVTWCWERIHANDVRYVREDLAGVKNNARDEHCMPDKWRLAKQGQINVGDVISLVVSGRRICTTAKEVLRAGTGAEEVIYNRKKNHYFITSMVLDGTSNHKDVYIIPENICEVKK